MTAERGDCHEEILKLRQALADERARGEELVQAVTDGYRRGVRARVQDALAEARDGCASLGALLSPHSDPKRLLEICLERIESVMAKHAE
jgi:hypothetical protein